MTTTQSNHAAEIEALRTAATSVTEHEERARMASDRIAEAKDEATHLEELAANAKRAMHQLGLGGSKEKIAHAKSTFAEAERKAKEARSYASGLAAELPAITNAVAHAKQMHTHARHRLAFAIAEERRPSILEAWRTLLTAHRDYLMIREAAGCSSASHEADVPTSGGDSGVGALAQELGLSRSRMFALNSETWEDRLSDGQLLAMATLDSRR